MRLRHFLRGAKLPLLLLLIAVLSALTKIGINSFTGLFWHFRREITNYLISNVGNWLAVLYWIAHGVALLCAAVYWTSKFGLQAIGSGRCRRATSSLCCMLTRDATGVPEVKSILSVRRCLHAPVSLLVTTLLFRRAPTPATSLPPPASSAKS
jgi:hypothetical protein